MAEPQHLASPMEFNATGMAKTVVQESEQDRLDRAFNVCVCVEGTREDNPVFGIPDLTFTQAPVDIAAIQTAVETWAGIGIAASEAEEAYAAARRVTLEVS